MMQRQATKSQEILDGLNQAENKGCQDVLWVILFLGQFLGMGIYSVTEMAKVEWDTVFSAFDELKIWDMVGILFSIAFIAAFFSFCFRFFLSSVYPNVMKYSLIIYNVCIIGCIVIWGIFTSWADTWGPIILVSFLVFFDLYCYAAWGQKNFAEEVIKTSNKVLCGQNLVVMFSFFVGLIAQFVCLVWVFGYVGLVDAAGLNIGLLILFFLSYYWTNNCFFCILHYIVSSITAYWCFDKDKVSPVWVSTKRAFTSGFGTIAFGSLVASLLAMIRAVLARVCCGNVNPCCGCLLDSLDNLIKTYNLYSLSMAALNGESYLTSAKSVASKLGSNSGLELISNEVLTRVPLLAGMLSIGLTAGVIGAGIIAAKYGIVIDKNNVMLFLAIWILCFYLSWGVASTMLDVSHSAIITTYLCWSEDPGAFAANRPEEYDSMIVALRESPVLTEEQANGYFSIEGTGNIQGTTANTQVAQ